MTDVRALLRAERASRRVAHPYATYSSSGQLSCSVCGLPVKPESAWDSHLRSRQHVISERRQMKASPGPVVTKKRKIDDDVSNTSKKSRSDQQSTSSKEVTFDNTANLADSHEVTARTAANAQQRQTLLSQSNSILPGLRIQGQGILSVANIDGEVDEKEWEAFQRDVAGEQGPSALTAPATIQAQPISASDLHAQAEDDMQQSYRDRRLAELDAEREDASRQLEDEFEQMESLQLRVERLKEQREALRNRPEHEKGAVMGTHSAHAENSSEQVVENFEDEEDDEDEYEEEDSWHFTRP